MRVIITILGLIFMLICSSYMSVDNWSLIKEKTWIAKSGGCINGEQIVFYESANGVKRAIRQLYGSGVYVISTIQYDVDLSKDTLYLFGVENKTANFKLIYSNNDFTLDSGIDSVKYKIQSNEPIIYNWQGDFQKGEILPIDTLKKIPIRIGICYDSGIFVNKGLKRKVK